MKDHSLTLSALIVILCTAAALLCGCQDPIDSAPASTSTDPEDVADCACSLARMGGFEDFTENAIVCTTPIGTLGLDRLPLVNPHTTLCEEHHGDTASAQAALDAERLERQMAMEAQMAESRERMRETMRRMQEATRRMRQAPPEDL